MNAPATPPVWLSETTRAFLIRRTGLAESTLDKRLAHRDCPAWEAVERGPTGRLIRLRITKETLAWLLRPVAGTNTTHGVGHATTEGAR